jgi:chromosome segregation ATPase
LVVGVSTSSHQHVKERRQNSDLGFVNNMRRFCSVVNVANFVLYRSDLEEALTEAISGLERKLDMKILIIQNITEDNGRLESKLEEKDAKILALEKEINRLTAALTSSEVFTNIFEERIEELDSVTNGLRDLNYEQYVKLESKVQMIVDLEREVRDVRVASNLLCDKISELETKYASMSKKYEKLLNWVVCKERELAALTADFGDLLIGMNHFLLLFIEYLVIVLLVMLESIL